MKTPASFDLYGLSRPPFLFAAAVFFCAISSPAATRTWNGTTGTDWDLSTNPPWDTAKPTSVDSAVFNTSLAVVANAVADQRVGSILFDTAAGTDSGSFTIGAVDGNSFILTHAGSVSILSTLVGTGKSISINSPITLIPASASTNGSYTFSNNSADANNTLNFGGAILGGITSGTQTLNLRGTNTGSNVITGSIGNGGATSLALSKATDAGRWILAGANTYTGQTTVSAGTLQIGHGGTTGSLAVSGLIALSSSGKLVFNRSDTVTQGVDFSSAAIGAGGVNTSLVQAGSGTLILNTNGNRVGTVTINEGGTLQLGDDVTDAGGLFGTSSIVNNGRFVLNRLGNASQAGSLSSAIISGTGSLTQAGAAQLILSLANTYSGTTSVASGTLALSNAQAIQNSALDTTGAGHVILSGGGLPAQTLGGLIGSTNLATFVSTGYSSLASLTLNPGSGKSHTYSGVIANGAVGMTLTKTGGGTQELAGANTYTGVTLVNDGTLILSGSISGTSNNAASVFVASGATFAGPGTLNLANGNRLSVSGTLAPGNPNAIIKTGTFYVAEAGASTTVAPGAGLGSFNLAAEGRLSIKLGSTFAGGSAASPAFNDAVNVTGTVSLDSNSVLAVSLLTGFITAPTDLFFIVINDGMDLITGTFGGLAQGAVVTFTGPGGLSQDFSISYTADFGSNAFTAFGGNDIALMAVPEPSTIALLGMLAIGLAFRRGRR